MKMVKALIVILTFAVMAWAQGNSRPPCQHRGLFYSIGVGFAYTSFESDKNRHYGWGSAYFDDFHDVTHDDDDRSWKFSGFDIPKFEYRIGVSIANHVALYTLWDMGLFTGETEFTESDYVRVYREQNGTLVKINEELRDYRHRKDNGVGLYFSFGLGISVYPISNLASPLNGLYVSFAGGFDAFAAGFVEEHEDGDAIGIFNRYEIGKDWWVSDTWSVGVAFAYKNLFVIDDDDGYYEHNKSSRHTISLLFRLTRG